MNLKQKIPLFCFIGLTVIVSITMTVMDIMTLINSRNAQQAITIYQQEITTNSQKRPSYNDKNKDAIRKDIDDLKKVTENYKLQFGKPHRNELKKFALAIGYKDGENANEQQLIKEFADYYKALKNEDKGSLTDVNDKKIWENFRELLYRPSKNGEPIDFATKKYVKSGKDVSEEDLKVAIKRKKTVDDAFANFAEYAKQYVEYKAPGTQYKCLLDALGLPTTGTFLALRELLRDQNYWKEEIPGLEEQLKNKDMDEEKIENLLKTRLISLNIDWKNQPPQILIYRQLQIKQDIYRRMKRANVAKVESVMLDVADNSAAATTTMNANVPEPLAGVGILGNNFLKYTYKIKFQGSMESIRDFLDELNNAYNDCRIYNVRDVSFLTHIIEKDELEKILEDDKDSKISEGQEVPESYGRIVIGKDLNVSCEILVDYIMYVQDILPRQKKE